MLVISDAVTRWLTDLILGLAMAEGGYHWLFLQLNWHICTRSHSPKCRHDHRLKQDPRWKVEQRPDGAFVWTTPSGRQYATALTEYPV